MTRLTIDLIEDIPLTLEQRDKELTEKLGLTLKGLAVRAVCPSAVDLDLSHIRAAAVPIDSGKGIIPTFSHSISAIVQHIGMDCTVTENSDVAGLAEAISAGADIVFMADDQKFIALNIRNGKYVDNTASTALGYCTVLETALGRLTGRDVLVIGAGRVGSVAVKRLKSRGARVSVLEVDEARAIKARRELDVPCIADARAGISRAQVILNAAPVIIPGHWIREGAVISSPGVPYSFDLEGERRASLIIHDPLQIGVGVMAVWCAMYSSSTISETQPAQETAEVPE